MSVIQGSFFNTISLSGPSLQGARGKAEGQNGRIIEIMKSGQPMTPFQVWEHYRKLYPEAPITSLRRSMTVLTKQGKLQKVKELKPERLGKPNHVWRIANGN